MKNKINLIGLLILSLGFVFASCEQEDDSIDTNEIIGEFLNWTQIPDVAVATEQTATKLKVSHDATDLYFLVLGNEMETDHQLFIDADNNSTTGFKDAAWKDAGFEYMLENNMLLKSKYNGSTWGWTEMGTESVDLNVSASMKEFRIKRAAFETLTGRIKVGFKDKTQSRVICMLPIKDTDAAIYVIDSLAVTTFEITASAGAGGSIDASATVKQGDSITFMIYPDAGWKIEAVIVDNIDRGIVSDYTFRNVQSNHTISATFIEIDNRLITLSPYLINYGFGTMDLLFRTLESVESVTVDWGAGINYENNTGELTVNDLDGEQRYQVRMSNLNAGQKYYYRVNVDTASLTGSFYPVPVSGSGTFSFYGVGDTQDAYEKRDDGKWPPGMGKDEVAHAIFNDITLNESERQTFVLYTGDLNDDYDYENWYGCFFNPRKTYTTWLNRNAITIATQGNHDGANTDHSKFNDFFPCANTDDITSGGGYYSVNYGSVHLVAIDPYGNDSWSDEGGHPLPGEPQWIWLENDLKTASENPDIKFIICFYHTSAYTIGEHPDNVVMQNVAKALFEPYGVDLCLSGHNHYYSRGIVENIVHMTLGSGGATFGSSTGLNSETDPYITKYAEGTFFTKFTVTADELNVEVIQHIGDGAVNPTPVDSFTVNASDN